MKKLLLLLVVAALVGGGVFAWRARNGSEEETAPAPAAEARTGPLRVTVASTGRVVSNLDVEIKCKASGEVVKLPFDVSDRVEKGNLLLELDPADEERRVRQAEVALDSSQARLAIARENLAVAERELVTARGRAGASLTSAEARAADARQKAARVKQLFESGLASPEERETAETSAVQAASDLELARLTLEELKTEERRLEVTRQQVVIAEGEVEADRIALDLARQSLADTRVLAPMDGVVTKRSVQIGQIISSGISNVGGGTTAMVLSDLSRIFVLASVDESDIGRVRLGQPVSVEVDAFPARTFEGSVVRVATQGVNVSNVVTFEVKIEVLSRDKELLRPEMTASVEILVDERESALLVPADAVVRRQGSDYVRVRAADGSEEEREVTTGLSDGALTEIARGLSEGETVVSAGPNGGKWRGENGSDRRSSRGPLGFGRH